MLKEHQLFWLASSHSNCSHFLNSLLSFEHIQDVDTSVRGRLKRSSGLMFQVLYSRLGSWLYPQTLDKAGKGCQGQTLAYYKHL